MRGEEGRREQERGRGRMGSGTELRRSTKNGEIQEITLERRSVDLRPVRTRRLRNESHTLGYLRITQFSEGVPEQIKEALEELSDKEIENINILNNITRNTII